MDGKRREKRGKEGKRREKKGIEGNRGNGWEKVCRKGRKNRQWDSKNTVLLAKWSLFRTFSARSLLLP